MLILLLQTAMKCIYYSILFFLIVSINSGTGIFSLHPFDTLTWSFKVISRKTREITTDVDFGFDALKDIRKKVYNKEGSDDEFTFLAEEPAEVIVNGSCCTRKKCYKPCPFPIVNATVSKTMKNKKRDEGESTDEAPDTDKKKTTTRPIYVLPMPPPMPPPRPPPMPPPRPPPMSVGYPPSMPGGYSPSMPEGYPPPPPPPVPNVMTIPVPPPQPPRQPPFIIAPYKPPPRPPTIVRLPIMPGPLPPGPFGMPRRAMPSIYLLRRPENEDENKPVQSTTPGTEKPEKLNKHQLIQNEMGNTMSSRRRHKKSSKRRRKSNRRRKRRKKRRRYSSDSYSSDSSSSKSYSSRSHSSESRSSYSRSKETASSLEINEKDINKPVLSYIDKKGKVRVIKKSLSSREAYLLFHGKGSIERLNLDDKEDKNIGRSRKRKRRRRVRNNKVISRSGYNANNNNITQFVEEPEHFKPTVQQTINIPNIDDKQVVMAESAVQHVLEDGTKELVFKIPQDRRISNLSVTYNIMK